MGIEKEILAWNGKSADDIAEIFRAHCQDPKFIEGVIKLIGSSAGQKGATWLLKAWLDSGHSITDKQTSKVIDLFGSLEHWESKLHILQCFAFFSFKKSKKLSVERFLRSTLADNNKFVRAWSYNGFYELAKQHPEYREETKKFFEMAMRDEAASVKARIRNIMKKGF